MSAEFSSENLHTKSRKGAHLRTDSRKGAHSNGALTKDTDDLGEEIARQQHEQKYRKKGTNPEEGDVMERRWPRLTTSSSLCRILPKQQWRTYKDTDDLGEEIARQQHEQKYRKKVTNPEEGDVTERRWPWWAHASSLYLEISSSMTTHFRRSC